MKMKKLVTLITVATMAMITGCGANGSDSKTTQNVTTTAADSESETTQTDAASTEDQATASGNVLVVYYSATGSTKEVVETIADTTGGDLFEITPKEPYTSDDLNWSDDNSRVSREHEDESLRDVELTTTTVDNWDSYDTVFIGYPIWWGEAPHIMYSLVENVSLKGKTVVPFNTSASSGTGSSSDHLKDHAIISKKTNWKNGKSFYGTSFQKTVNKWVKTIK